MKEAHIFDLDVLININSNVWIVSINNPSIPIIKISLSEFNLIKKGIYKNHNSNLEINGKKYWLPQNLFNLIKIEVKKHKEDFSNLSFSMQEYLNPNVIKHLDYELNTCNFQHLKNKSHDIYVIASKNSKVNYKEIIKKLESELEKIGIKVKEYFFLTKTFNNKDLDSISNNKVKICLQYLVGYKTNLNVFTQEVLDKYDRVYLYDDDMKTLEFGKKINNILDFLRINTENELVINDIKLSIRRDMPVFVLATITHNKVNPIIYEEIILEWNHITKKFENFKY
jgi:hypothetical protein